MVLNWKSGDRTIRCGENLLVLTAADATKQVQVSVPSNFRQSEHFFRWFLVEIRSNVGENVSFFFFFSFFFLKMHAPTVQSLYDEIWNAEAAKT